MFLAKRATMVFALSVAALIGFSVMSAIPANAATSRPGSVAPAYAIVCGGDACIQTAYKGSYYANVNTWAFRTTFYGHFELQNTGCGYPGLHIANSTNATWPAGGTHYTFKNIIYSGMGCGGDNWTIIPWRRNSNGTWTDLGAVGFSI